MPSYVRLILLSLPWFIAQTHLCFGYHTPPVLQIGGGVLFLELLGRLGREKE